MGIVKTSTLKSVSVRRKAMPKYLVSYTETNVYSTTVEAVSEEEAEKATREEISVNDVQSFRHVDSETLIQVEGELNA